MFETFEIWKLTIDSKFKIGNYQYNRIIKLHLLTS